MSQDPEFSLLTVEEYYELAHREDVIEELHWGRLVELPHPKPWRFKLQRHILDLLDAHAGTNWEVLPNLAFRAMPQYDLRGVDVGVIAKRRVDSLGDGDMFGSPDVVVDILPLSGDITNRAPFSCQLELSSSA